MRRITTSAEEIRYDIVSQCIEWREAHGLTRTMVAKAGGLAYHDIFMFETRRRFYWSAIVAYCNLGCVIKMQRKVTQR